MDLIEFAKNVESGSISLESAKSRLNVSNEQLPYLKDNNGMDLLQIAIKNNYMNLFKEIIKGINIKDRNISEGKMYAQVGGEPVTKKPRYVYSSQHIDLFSKFDLFRDDNYGQCALAYALVNNHEMFYKLIELSKDKRI